METTVTEEIVKAIADAENRAPESLDVVLEDHVDTEAIRFLAAHDSDSWTLRFETPNHTVTVVGGEEVCVDGAPKQTL